MRIVSLVFLGIILFLGHIILLDLHQVALLALVKVMHSEIFSCDMNWRSIRDGLIFIVLVLSIVFYT